MLLALAFGVLLAAAACSGGGDGDGGDDSDAAYDRYMRQVCVASGRAFSAVISKVTPGARPSEAVMIEAWEQFIDDLEDAQPPAAMEEHHQAWLEMLRDDLAALRSGTPTYYDPFDHGPDIPDALEERLQVAAERVPECQQPYETPTGTETQTPGALPTPAAASPQIDYSNPTKYVEPGAQSRLSDANAAAVRSEVGMVNADLLGAGAIAAWLRAGFRTEPTGGTTIGKTDVNTLIGTRILTGCHDGALVMATTLRLYGIPAVMVDTAAIQWAEDYRAGQTRSFTGHVFVEAYIEGDWILIECGSAHYTSDYDPGNPVIAVPVMPDPKGYYALLKGVDPAAYGVTSGDILRERMEQFVNDLPGLTLEFPAYDWQPLPAR